MSDPAYRLLLELAGRVDDDLLAAGRELVAVGEEGHALELLVAELVAGRVELPGDQLGHQQLQRVPFLADGDELPPGGEQVVVLSLIHI